MRANYLVAVTGPRTQTSVLWALKHIYRTSDKTLHNITVSVLPIFTNFISHFQDEEENGGETHR